MVGLISSVCVLVFAAALTYLFLYLDNKKFERLLFIRRAVAVGLFFVTFLRYAYDQPPLYFAVGLDSAASPFSSPVLTALGILILWFTYAAMIMLVTREFFSYKTLDGLAILFAAPVFLIASIFFGFYATASLGSELVLFSTARLFGMIIELVLGLSLIASHILIGVRTKDGSLAASLSLPVGRVGVLRFVGVLIAAIVLSMPCFVPEAFIGEPKFNPILYDLTEGHRIMIYLSIIIPVVLFRFFKDKPADVKRFLMIYMSLAFFWSYIGRWDLAEWKDPTGWPLQLCNTAMILVPLMLIFNWEKLFNFSLFINVIGAMLAMILPNEYADLSAIGTERVNFWLNHWSAFGMPLLIIALGVFKRPKFREWVYSVIELTVYYVSILFINALFTSMYGECDFFFTNGDFIVSTFGEWAERTMDFTVSFKLGAHTLTFYPVYQSLFYIVYIGFTVGMWFVFELLFSMWDASADRRSRERDYQRMKKELNEYLGGKSIHEPVSGDSSARIIITNFSKRYGSNAHYSVKDVTFSVKGGEIFGFLGPNGAGKSTIIKSMVGIQTITSGNIEICGFDVEKQPVQAKLHTGFVPDHYALYENLTGREYINYIADLFEVNKAYRDDIIEKLVTRFQLVGSFDNQMKTYSHGMKQKITIMAALVHNPKVWILDEPLTGLDPTSIYEVKECMKEHAAKGNVVFFSSHIIDVVEKICDRIAVIKKGKLRAVTTIKELAERGIELEEFYLSIINTPDDEPTAETKEVGAV